MVRFQSPRLENEKVRLDVPFRDYLIQELFLVGQMRFSLYPSGVYLFCSIFNHTGSFPPFPHSHHFKDMSWFRPELIKALSPTNLDGKLQ